MMSSTPSLEMAHPNSQNNDRLGNDPQNSDLLGNDPHENDPLDNNPQNIDPLCNDPQDDSQDCFQNDPPTVFDPPQGEKSISNFERLFTSILPFQTSVMSNLDRLDFLNLRLAGVKTPISVQVQKKYLIPTKCDELCIFPGRGRPLPCPNTTKAYHGIRACHGVPEDQERPEQWIKPKYHLRHYRKSGGFVKTISEDKGSQRDLFHVCVQCHDRNEQNRRSEQVHAIASFHSSMCRSHCLEYKKQQPYNTCHCEMFVEEYWRCKSCSYATLRQLQDRARASQKNPVHRNYSYAGPFGDPGYVGPFGDPGDPTICPMVGCTRQPWLTPPLEWQMMMCRACDGIFPYLQQYAD